jgi:ABC-type dipeptide/oligopeptide/nickel transport system ATPase subunit
MDILNKIKRILNDIKNRFVAGSNKEGHLRLRFGTALEVIGLGTNMGLNNRKQSFESGGIYWKKMNKEQYISPKFESNPHIVISGMSGFGKSTLFRSLLIDIRKAGIACILFDAHNEHSDTVRGLGGHVHNAMYSGINILELDGASVSERISEITRLLKEVYSLGYIQATKLSDCLWYTYRKAGARSRSDTSLNVAPTIKELISEINIFIRNSKSVGETHTLMHLRDRLSLLNSSAFNSGFINMQDLGGSLHSFSLANMKSKEVQLIYIGELLNRLYTTMHDSKKQNSLRLYIMIDEAQFLVDNSNNNSIIAKLIEEGRKYGVGVIIVTHAASTLNKKIMANCSVFATFYAREPSEVNYISRVLSGSDSYVSDALRSRISRLKQNQVILISSCIRSPVIISTPKFSDITVVKSKESEPEIMELLSIKAKRPVRYIDLIGTSSALEDSALEHIISLGFLDKLTIDVDGSNEDWFMLHNKSLSIEHEVWVLKISEFLFSMNIPNAIVDNSTGPDIILRGNNRIAIEYETGLKSLESTKKMIELRLSKFEKVIIFTKDSSFRYYKDNFEGERVFVLPIRNIRSVMSLL